MPILSSAFAELHDVSSTFLADTLAGLDAQLDKFGLSEVSAFADQVSV